MKTEVRYIWQKYIEAGLEVIVHQGVLHAQAVQQEKYQVQKAAHLRKHQVQRAAHLIKHQVQRAAHLIKHQIKRTAHLIKYQIQRAVHLRRYRIQEAVHLLFQAVKKLTERPLILLLVQRHRASPVILQSPER